MVLGLQTQPTPRIYNGPLDCVSKLYANGGLSQIFRAQVPCMIRDGVGMGCYFLTYEALVQRHLRVNGGERGDISPFYAVGFGAAAGYGLWFRSVLVSHPFSLSVSVSCLVLVILILILLQSHHIHRSRITIRNYNLQSRPHPFARSIR